MNKYIYVGCLLFISACFGCESDKLDVLNYGTIEGQVLDGESYQPLSGVMISTTPASITLLTDAEGRFSIPKVKEGDIEVNLKRKDYIANSLKVAAACYFRAAHWPWWHSSASKRTYALSVTNWAIGVILPA